MVSHKRKTNYSQNIIEITHQSYHKEFQSGINTKFHKIYSFMQRELLHRWRWMPKEWMENFDHEIKET